MLIYLIWGSIIISVFGLVIIRNNNLKYDQISESKPKSSYVGLSDNFLKFRENFLFAENREWSKCSTTRSESEIKLNIFHSPIEYENFILPNPKTVKKDIVLFNDGIEFKPTEPEKLMLTDILEYNNICMSDTRDLVKNPILKRNMDKDSIQ